MNYLYHNNRDGTFTRIDPAKMPKIPSNQHGAAWGDYDNDGHLDLIVTAGNPEITHSVVYRKVGAVLAESPAASPAAGGAAGRIAPSCARRTVSFRP